MPLLTKTKFYCGSILLLPTLLFAQENSSLLNSKSEVGIGLLNMYYNYEQKLFDPLTVQIKASYNLGFNINRDASEFYTSVAFTVEPRLYYNIKSRANKGKNIKNNGANFFSLQYNYIPGFLANTALRDKHAELEYASNYTPAFSIRRNIKETNFNYEFLFGLGFETIKSKHSDTKNNTFVAFNAKLAYSF